jgi:hypothetical protein
VIFDLASALKASASGELEAWVHNYLRGPGRNPAFSSGLLLRRRFWQGPLLLPVTVLQRQCGPEPEMPFPVPEAVWKHRVSELAANFVALEAFPPLIAEYRSGNLLVSDGNHRLAAFAALGMSSCWTIVWFPDESEKMHYEASCTQLPRRSHDDVE